MTREQLNIQLKVIRDVTEKACKSKRAARKFLRDAGILPPAKKRNIIAKSIIK